VARLKGSATPHFTEVAAGTKVVACAGEDEGSALFVFLQLLQARKHLLSHVNAECIPSRRTIQCHDRDIAISPYVQEFIR
jgi:hypothetical protein